MLKPFPGDPESRIYAEVIAERLANEAAGGDVQAAREIFDRLEGKATQRVETLQRFESLERMTTEELERFAETGALPAWFQGQPDDEPS